MENEYLVQNLYEAAYLLSAGHKLLGKKGQAIVFPLEARGGGVEYYNGAMVDAKTFAANYQMLKDFIKPVE